MVYVAVSLLFLLLSHPISSEPQEDDDHYYGVPIGALRYSSEGTQAEVYAADEYTIIFHRFTHRPKEEGCMAIMVGPKRVADREAVLNEGVLLAISQPLFTSARPKNRLTRQAPFDFFTINKWPIEFDHLKMPQDERSRTLASQLDPFAGIELDIGQSLDAQPQAKEILIDSAPTAKDADQAENESAFQASPKAINVSETMSLKSDRVINPARVRGVVTSRTTTTTESTLSIDAQTTNLNADDSQSSETQATMLSSEGELPSSSAQPGAPSVILFRKASELATTTPTITMADGTSGDEIKTSEIPTIREQTRVLSDYSTVLISSSTQAALREEKLGNVLTTRSPAMIVVLNDKHRNANDEGYYGREREVDDGNARAHVEWVTKSNGLHRNNNGGQTIMLGRATTTEVPRRAPSRHHMPASKFNQIDGEKEELILSDKFFDTDNVVPVSTQGFSTPAPSRKSTPLYYVIEDPRAKRRRQKGHMEGAAKDILEDERKDKSGSPAATRTHFDRKYVLPVMEEKTAAFALTNGAKIVDYEWIGLYDKCKKHPIPLLSLKGIDPPREEKIAPISGWSHNVTSYRVQILNCNSLLIPGFTYNGTNSPEGTFFYVGIGHFPDNIEEQVRASVVGHPLDEPLRSYIREDVMLRLPKTYRTFDIDFLSVYNDVEKRSYGHVIIPSLLVPPCSEDD